MSLTPGERSAIRTRAERARAHSVALARPAAAVRAASRSACAATSQRRASLDAASPDAWDAPPFWVRQWLAAEDESPAGAPAAEAVRALEAVLDALTAPAVDDALRAAAHRTARTLSAGELRALTRGLDEVRGALGGPAPTGGARRGPASDADGHPRRAERLQPPLTRPTR